VLPIADEGIDIPTGESLMRFISVAQFAQGIITFRDLGCLDAWKRFFSTLFLWNLAFVRFWEMRAAITKRHGEPKNKALGGGGSTIQTAA
jgi:hypothetical protein